MTMMPMTVRRPVFAGLALIPTVFLAIFAAAAPQQPKKLRYNKDVRPILAENCFPCHGPDSAARKAGLRLDRSEDATALRSGHMPIAKGNPAASEVVKRITGNGPLMPPEVTKKKLTPQQIATLKQWISQGAEYERHWSYIPPARPALPVVKNAAWVRNPIDRFILAKLEQNGLTPAPEADRRTLARRLSLDLTGLPPEPSDVEAFVNDKSPNAYEKLVDKYMAMPQWGEHRGRYWLDAARYADSHGIHFDNYREMYSYRDWVIKALNQNMHFDQFTIEQLAGDLLPNPTLDQEIATGFNRCNITSNEGGMIAEEYLVLYARDRTETTSAVWLGSTLNCCVCHDHKFDPFTQRDFYSMSALFNNSTQAAGDGNIKDTPPIMPVPLAEDQSRYEKLKAEIPTVRKQADERKIAARADFDKYLAQSNIKSAAGTAPTQGLIFRAELSEGQGKEVYADQRGEHLHLTATGEPGWLDGHVAAKAFQRKKGSTVEFPNAGDFEKDQSWTESAWIKLPKTEVFGPAIARMDDQHDYRGWDLWIENGSVGTHIVSKWPENALKVVSRDKLQANKWHHVCITYSGQMTPESVKVYIDGDARSIDTQMNTLKSTIRTTVPLKLLQRHSSSGLDNASIQEVRLYNRALSPKEVVQLSSGARAGWLLSKGTKDLAAGEKDELFGWWLSNNDSEYRSVSTKLAGLEKEQKEILARGTVAHVMNEKPTDAMAYILFRGDYDKRKDSVKPATPAVLPPLPADYPKNRLGFAKWLLLPEHPLTARVTVNRFWQELFGTGIVRTAGDFGVTGELPSHPELLDWLAVEFREGGWDMKKFFKMLVTSATYRQSSAITPDKKQKDPANRLLSRGPHYRMDAEMVRDYALSASGLLVKKIGGRSVRPYQPDGVWEAVAMPESDTRNYKRDTGDSLYRRSMYTFWKRAAPPASMDIFNAPNRETCCVRRERTNTPLQALVTMNDIQFVESARNLAQRALLNGGSTTDSQIDFIARRLMARPLRTEEAAVVKKSLANLSTFYGGHSKEAQELIMTGESKPDAALKPEKLAAFTMLCNQMLNLDEVLNK